MNVNLDVKLGRYRELTKTELKKLEKLLESSTKTHNEDFLNQNEFWLLDHLGRVNRHYLKKLNSLLNLPVIHLDVNYHNPNWQEPTKEEWEII